MCGLLCREGWLPGDVVGRFHDLFGMFARQCRLAGAKSLYPLGVAGCAAEGSQMDVVWHQPIFYQAAARLGLAEVVGHIRWILQTDEDEEIHSGA